MKTTQIIKILTIASSSLAALMGGLATLPVPSDHLPMPETWRPYLVSVAFLAAAVRLVIIPFLDSIIKGLKETNLSLWILLLSLSCFTFFSCAELPLTGSLSYIDKSGAKGGMIFTPNGQTTGFVRVPIKDPETGLTIGHTELSLPIVILPEK